MPRSHQGGQTRHSAALHKASVLAGRTDPIPEGALDLSALSYRELQTFAKENGIKASGSRKSLYSRILNSLPED